MTEIAYALNTTDDTALVYDVTCHLSPDERDDVYFTDFAEITDFLDVYLSEVTRG